MEQRNKLIVGFTTIVLSGTLAFGAIASASGAGDGSGNGNGGGRKHLTTEEKCDKVDEVRARAADIQQRISERIPVLQQRRAEAETNGDTERVERLDRLLARLEKASARIIERLAKVETWAAANFAA